ncbi:MAG: chorismate mutase [Actinobacteria bacterium]|jgi:chorismate mutase|nr:chorismate mutase [Actinomycetota bacterium]
MSTRAIRGAIQIAADTESDINAGVAQLLKAIMEANQIELDSIISVLLTSTPDLTSAFPAAGARALGFTEIPLMCAAEIDVKGALERVIRVMLHVESERKTSEISHIYLGGAQALRRDIAQ